MLLVIGILTAHPLTTLAQQPEPSSDVADMPVNQLTNAFLDPSVIGATISPENPGAFETTSFFLTSNLINLSTTSIKWLVDGVEKKSGIGERTLTVTTKNYGQPVTIEAHITTSQGVNIKKFILEPQDTVILWEAVDAHVPAFYPGKKLIPKEGLVAITALSQFSGTSVFESNKNNSFVWRRNGETIPNSSGYGKMTFLMKHNRVRSNELIEVQITNPTTGKKSSSTKTLSFINPKVLIYEENTTTGYQNPYAKKIISLDQDRTTLYAEPFFFSTPGGTENFATNWIMNGTAITNSQNTQRVRIAQPEGSGRSTIGFSIENPFAILQSAQQSIELIFR